MVYFKQWQFIFLANIFILYTLLKLNCESETITTINQVRQNKGNRSIVVGSRTCQKPDKKRNIPERNNLLNYLRKAKSLYQETTPLIPVTFYSFNRTLSCIITLKKYNNINILIHICHYPAGKMTEKVMKNVWHVTCTRSNKFKIT